MPRPRKGGRIYWRTRGGSRRAYADFRDYADVGGGLEALTPADQKYATSDPDVAAELVAARLQALNRARLLKRTLGVSGDGRMTQAVSRYLLYLAEQTDTSETRIASIEQRLLRAIAFFTKKDATRELATITVEDVEAYHAYLRTLSGKRGQKLSADTRKKHLNDLSGLFVRASKEKTVPLGYNPVAEMDNKPKVERGEAEWLEVHEAALLLEAARVYAPKREDMANPFVYQLIATQLLTGARFQEVAGLEWSHINLERGTIRFRRTDARRLKNVSSSRTVRIWPQLHEILSAYHGERPRKGLVFPAGRTGERVTDIRAALDAIALMCGWREGEIRTRIFRHTYCAARLQTLDHGEPVSVFTVARELGHADTAMVNRIYGHLGEIRFRSELVEYRVQNHMHIPDYAERLRRIA